MIDVGSPYWLYMSEGEDIKRAELLNRVIKDIRDIPTPTISDVQFHVILNKYGLKNISQDEMKYIMDGIR